MQTDTAIKVTDAHQHVWTLDLARKIWARTEGRFALQITYREVSETPYLVTVSLDGLDVAEQPFRYFGHATRFAHDFAA